MVWVTFGSLHKTIDTLYFGYEYLSQEAIEEENYLVLSLEKLLLQRAMAMQKPKYHQDLELVVKKITDDQYRHFEEMTRENDNLLSGISDIKFVEKVGPQNAR